MADDRPRRAVEVAERYADNEADDADREAALTSALSVRSIHSQTKWVVSAVARTGAIMIVDVAGQIAASPSGEEYYPNRWQAEWREQCILLRDIFGNPLCPGTFDPSWRRGNGGAAVVLAQEMYDSRDFTNAPLLADMMEDAGCTDPQILEHLRGSGPHVRGCWVVDLLLGKS